MKRARTYRTQSPTFGPWLLSQIERRGWTRAEFADRLGVSRTSVTRWVKDGRVPEASFIEDIADHLDLDYDYVAEQAGYRPHIEDDDLKDIHVRLDPLLRKMDEYDREILIDNARSLVRAAEIRRSHAADTHDESRPTTIQTADNLHPRE